MVMKWSMSCAPENILSLAITVILFAAAGAQAALTVTFVNPEHYRDRGRPPAGADTVNAHANSAHRLANAVRRLAPSQIMR